MKRPSGAEPARRRHPSAAGWRPDLASFTDRMAGVLADEGVKYPHVAAAVQSARGASGESVGDFAARLRLPVAWLERLESGAVGADDVPACITDAVPWADWAACRASTGHANPDGGRCAPIASGRAHRLSGSDDGPWPGERLAAP